MSLESWSRAAEPVPGGRRRLIVLIHGIFSSHRTFERMKGGLERRLAGDPGGGGAWEIAYFDYDYNQAIEANAKALDAALAAATSAADSVALVCHSMGGLVARAALLSGAAAPQRVRRVILLGTPNHGALRTSQLGLLAQVLASSGNGLTGVFLRKKGIQQLTDVDGLFAPLTAKPVDALEGIEYVTIPGTFFHPGRKAWEVGEWGESGLWKAAFAALGVASEIVTALLPLWSVTLGRPHDGIVEASSNNLIPAGPGRWCEKAAAINHPGRFLRPTYAHIEPRVCDELTHVMIHNDDKVIDLVADLVLAESLRAWYEALPAAALNELRVELPGVG